MLYKRIGIYFEIVMSKLTVVRLYRLSFSAQTSSVIEIFHEKF